MSQRADRVQILVGYSEDVAFFTEMRTWRKL
jgi:hypothetical protein